MHTPSSFHNRPRCQVYKSNTLYPFWKACRAHIRSLHLHCTTVPAHQQCCCLTTENGEPKLGLAMGEPTSGSADPYWQRLSDLIVQGSISSKHAEELKGVFTGANLIKWQGRVPSYLLSGVMLQPAHAILMCCADLMQPLSLWLYCLCHYCTGRHVWKATY